MHQYPDKLAPTNITHALSSLKQSAPKPIRSIFKLSSLLSNNNCNQTFEFVSSVVARAFRLNRVEMVNRRILFCVVLVTAWCEVKSAGLPFLPSRVGNEVLETGVMHPGGLIRGRVREGVPPPLCAGRCVAPPAGPVCAFDAAGVARTFATLCELEAVSCRESTYYAITSLGEC